jgi:hypothetical protein
MKAIVNTRNNTLKVGRQQVHHFPHTLCGKYTKRARMLIPYGASKASLIKQGGLSLRQINVLFKQYGIKKGRYISSEFEPFFKYF